MTALAQLCARAAALPDGEPGGWLELLEEAIDTDARSFPLMAAVAPSATAVQRAFAFVLATRSNDLSETRWLVAASLLCSSESLSDLSTATNLMTWMGRDVNGRVSLPALVRRAAGRFLVDALDGAPLLQITAVDTLVSLASAARTLFTRTTAKALLERLSDLLSSSDDLMNDDIRQLRARIRPTKAPAQIPFEPREIRLLTESVAEHIRPRIGRRQQHALDGWLQHVRFLEEGGAAASDHKSDVLELRLVEGVSGLGPLADLLASFEALLASVGRLLSPNAAAPTLGPLSAATGSFSFRAVSRPRVSDRRALALTHRLLSQVADIDRLKGSLGSDHETWKRLKGYLDQVSKQAGVVETALFSATAEHWRRVARVDPASAKRTADRIAEHNGETTTLARDRGYLVAANARAGTFTAQLKRHGEVEGNAATASTLTRVSLGRTYAFRLQITQSSRLVGVQDTWLLLQLDREEEAEDLADAGGSDRPVGKGDVPQAKLERALQVAELISRGKQPTPKLVGVKGQRNIDYYLHAARLLGLLDRENRITTVGRLAFAEDEDARMRRIAMKFEEMSVAEEWVAWAKRTRLADVDTSTAAAFLASQSSLKQGTIDTRAGYLRKWHKIFSPFWNA